MSATPGTRCNRNWSPGRATDTFAVGSIARQLLCHLGTDIVSHVVSIGSVAVPDPLALTYTEVRGIGPDTPLHCADADAEARMIAEIDRARDAGDTMGGSFEVIAPDERPGSLSRMRSRPAAAGHGHRTPASRMTSEWGRQQAHP